MEKRGWIAETSSLEDLESELRGFFGVESLETEPSIGVATRKSHADEPLSHPQRAWCFRVKQMAEVIKVGPYRESEVGDCIRELRKVAAYPQETHKVPIILAKYGIRFVVVQPLTKSRDDRVDGVALWLDQDSPVIGTSIQYDRNDSFWFTLCHELSHIIHRDESPLDIDLSTGAPDPFKVVSPVERRANEEASAMLIPKEEIESFVLRKAPLYSKQDIVKFAHRVRIHPGIIVGQLQHRDEIGYGANREMFSKIREKVVETALTDGWGHTFNHRRFQK